VKEMLGEMEGIKGMDLEEEKSIFRWMGRKRGWCDYKTNKMCVGLEGICRLLSQRE
jgi:hypothetical protein